MADAKANASGTEAVKAAEATLAAAKAKLAEADAAVKDAEAKLKDAKVRLADLERQAESGSSSTGSATTGKDTGSATGPTTTAAGVHPGQRRRGEQGRRQGQQGRPTGTDRCGHRRGHGVRHVLATAAGATMELRRRGQGRHDVMARHAD